MQLQKSSLQVYNKNSQKITQNKKYLTSQRNQYFFSALYNFVFYYFCRRDPCCTGRYDDCSQPILGTLCYCDEFCNRTKNPDCCPDYWEACLGITPTPVKSKLVIFNTRETEGVILTYSVKNVQFCFLTA